MTAFERAKAKRQKADPFANGPMLLLLKEKHGDAHFLVHNEAELHATALLIVKGRNKQRWYPDERMKPAPLGFDETDVERMPESLRKTGRAQLASYAEHLRDWEETREFAETLKLVLDKEDGAAAWSLLRQRCDHEYEEVRLEGFCKRYG